jgi:hypothetical protein
MHSVRSPTETGKTTISSPCNLTQQVVASLTSLIFITKVSNPTNLLLLYCYLIFPQTFHTTNVKQVNNLTISHCCHM